MTSFKLNGLTPGRELVSSISKLLDGYNIPSVLWGDCLLSVYGVPSGCNDISFVIPDDLMERAQDAVKEAYFVPCPRGEKCPVVNPRRTSPIPHAHFHIREGKLLEPAVTLDLHLKSQLLWAMPDFPLGILPGNPNFMYTSDPRLPEEDKACHRGRFPASLYPVKMPAVSRFAEALVLLYCRDADPEVTNRGAHWQLLHRYVVVYCCDWHGMLDLGLLKPRLAEYYALWAREPPYEAWLYASRLAAQMRENGELPPPPLPHRPAGGASLGWDWVGGSV
ncbi:uncharacterized protein ACLA_043680 [Aspergillus clavatus NRRL 1]|uniref:Thioredoxin reductase n=1 Tax=Aspergillus clavatus (strain ATCC 1007 / CBS 513.65 / DSM 816 / NCTC 3887 / NRRL 1 / QM 1276 / 107) TaxID=344612 RepID=A1C8L1_ASPCL|nr:uncharacterized protein ACLA_043680 [Aspergillus clavatus NRRL 1]EAW13648.1 conserved hypothetical protein [Aspergillus clavatus NRRL 1]